VPFGRTFRLKGGRVDFKSSRCLRGEFRRGPRDRRYSGDDFLGLRPKPSPRGLERRESAYALRAVDHQFLAVPVEERQVDLGELVVRLSLVHLLR
jgi:hypothetical protein